MSELFHTYEEQFIKNITNINSKIQNIGTVTNHKKEIAFTDLKSDLSDCENNIKLMDTEIIGFAPQTKFQYLRKVRQYKKDYDTAKKTLYKAEQDYAFEKNKEMLIGAELEDAVTPESHREKLIKQGQKLSDTTYKLKDSVKVMHQTADISNNIQIQLQEHTQKLISNKSKLGGIRGQLVKGQQKIKNMMVRIRRNKFVLFSVLAAIALIGIIILGIHFGKK